jgi:hypothetical protein
VAQHDQSLCARAAALRARRGGLHGILFSCSAVIVLEPPTVAANLPNPGPRRRFRARSRAPPWKPPKPPNLHRPPAQAPDPRGRSRSGAYSPRLDVLPFRGATNDLRSTRPTFELLGLVAHGGGTCGREGPVAAV